MWVFWRGREKNTGTAQMNNNISAIYSWCGIFLGMLGIFLGRQILKLGFFWV